MSLEDVEVVRGLNEPYEGEDVAPIIRESVDRFGPDPDPDTVLAEWAKDPAWCHIHPDIEWDMTGAGAVGVTANGPREVALFWADWIEAWKSYVYRVVEYRDLGDWVLTPVDVRASGPEGIPVEMRLFQVWRVRDGKVAAQRAFLSEQAALEAAGLREWRLP
jgi:ketosteroid isomerase-like protein